MQTEVLLELPK